MLKVNDLDILCGVNWVLNLSFVYFFYRLKKSLNICTVLHHHTDPPKLTWDFVVKVYLGEGNLSQSNISLNFSSHVFCHTSNQTPSPTKIYLSVS